MWSFRPSFFTVAFAAALAVAVTWACPAEAAASPLHVGYLELAGGAHAPVYGPHYRDFFGPGPRVGVRGGAFRPPAPGGRHALALEFAFEWDHLSDQVPDLRDQTYEFDEYRCMLGARWLYFAGPRLQLYGRLAGGVEVLATGGTARWGKRDFNVSESDAGFVAELGVGASWRLGGVNVGAELAVPWARHEDDGVVSRYDLDTAYDALSLDVLLTVSTRR
jgi:hypothetical protein